MLNRPAFSPDCIVAHLAPGEVIRAGTRLTSPAAEARVIPAIRNGGATVRYRESILLQTVRRAYTEEEIRDLPLSQQGPARRGEILYEEVSSTTVSGESSITVRRGDVVEFYVDISIPPGASEGITTATLVIESSAWESTELPIICVVGPASSAVPVVIPNKIHVALTPGESKTPFVMIPNAPSTGSVVAFVVNGAGVIRLNRLIAFNQVVAEDGSVELVATGQSNGTQPLPVVARQMVQAHLDFTAPPTGFPNITEARLVIVSPRWAHTEIPLRLYIGRFEVEIVSGPVSISQGGSAGIVVSIRLWAGPGDVVQFSLDGDGGKIRISPVQLTVMPDPRHRPGVYPLVATSVTLFAADDLPMGSMPITFVARAFEQLQVYRVPLQLNVIPGGLSVGTRPWSITARQGDNVAFEVFANSEGPAKNMTFTPGALPRGVRIDPVSFPVGPGRASRIEQVRMVIDRDAPLTDRGWTPILWSANNGTHNGSLNLPVTIILNPEERIFRREITTPSGTALGGFAEIIVRNDGTYTFRGHLHDSGLDPYAFRVSVTVRGSDGIVSVGAVKSGRVAGTLGSGSRDLDWEENKSSPMLGIMWPTLRDATADFALWYDDRGVLGSLGDIAVALAEFIVGAVVVHPGVAAIIVLGSELGKLADMPLAHVPGLAGVVIAGGLVLLLGPSVVVPAVIAGIVAETQLNTRPLRTEEIAEAKKVFGDTLPIDLILLSNLSRGSTAFCIPLIDSTILIGLGGVNDGVTDRFENPMKHPEWRRTLIHELTHAWQIKWKTTVVEMVWSAAINETRSHDDIYAIPSSFDGRPWSKFGFEQQAKVVDTWYMVADAVAQLTVPPSPTLDSPTALSFWAFPYIQNNVRLGQT